MPELIYPTMGWIMLWLFCFPGGDSIMAQRPLRLCLHPGCSELTSESYCAKHKPVPRRKDSARKESAAWHGWYQLPIWTKDLRPAQLLREPYCRECTRRYPPDDPRHRTRATDVDHITPHRGDWDRFTDRGNLQSLCHRCHSRKTAREMAERAAKRQPF